MPSSSWPSTQTPHWMWGIDDIQTIQTGQPSKMSWKIALRWDCTGLGLHWVGIALRWDCTALGLHCIGIALRWDCPLNRVSVPAVGGRDYSDPRWRRASAGTGSDKTIRGSPRFPGSYGRR